MHKKKTSTMSAYVLEKFGVPLTLKTVDIPTPKGYQILAKTLCTGVCHTDLHVISGDFSTNTSILPLTPGHEGIGRVVSIGNDVQKIKVGDRIGVPWLGQACMTCYLCKNGRENLCENQLNTGFTFPGSFAEYFLADERFVALIPETLTSEKAAPIICAGLTVYSALKNASIPQKSRIVISGACGGLGHLAIQYARALGLEVIALDMMSDERKVMIKNLGCKFALDLESMKNSLIEKVFTLCDETQSIEAAIILAPVLSAVSDAVEYVAPGGTIICVGLPKGSYTIPCSKFVLKGLKLIGSIVGTPQELQEALNFAASGSINPHIEIKNLYEIPEILKDMELGKVQGRIVVKFSA